MSVKHIVVATDFSEYADSAAMFAAKLASKFDARISVVHVYDPAPLSPAVTYPAAVWMGTDFRGMWKRGSDKRLQQTREKLLGTVPQVSLQSIANVSASMAICDYAEQEGADLIVMGTHGLTGFGRLLLGSVAERVIRHAASNVLVVRRTSSPEAAPRRILVATDFSPAADPALSDAAMLANTLGAAVTLLHVYNTEWTAAEGMFGSYRSMEDIEGPLQDALAKSCAKHFDSSASVALVEGHNPALEIARYAEENDADLVVMATHGRTGVSRLLVGSVTEKATRHAPCSVWVSRAAVQTSS